MIQTLINLFRKDSLYHQALEECHHMLDLDWSMFKASVHSLRHSDSAEVNLDVYGTDKQVNASERDVRRKVLTHLVVSGAATELSAGLALVVVVIDIERIGDYSKCIYSLACNHPERLHGGSLEKPLSEVEAGVTHLFSEMVEAFKTSDPEIARRVMTGYKADLAATCEEIVMDVVSGKVRELSPADAASIALYARYLKRIAAHSRNVVSSIVNPFHRIGYKEKQKLS